MKLSNNINSRHIHILSLLGLVILILFIIIIPSQYANMNLEATPTSTEPLLQVGAVQPLYTSITIRFTAEWFVIRFEGDTPVSLDGLSLRRAGANADSIRTPSEDFGLLIGKLANPASCYFYTEDNKLPDSSSATRRCDDRKMDVFQSSFWTPLDTVDIFWHGELVESCPSTIALEGCPVSLDLSQTFTPTPTETPSPMPTDTPPPMPTDTPTITPIPTDTPTFTPVPTDTPTATPAPTDTYTPSPTPTFTHTPEPVVCPSELREGIICIPAQTYRIPKPWRNIDRIVVVDTEIVIEQPFFINQYPIEYELFATYLLNSARLTPTPSNPLNSPSLTPIPLLYAPADHQNADNYCDYTYIGDLPTEEQLLVAYYYQQYANFPPHGQSVHREWTSELIGEDDVALLWDSEEDIFASISVSSGDGSRVPIYFRCVFHP